MSESAGKPVSPSGRRRDAKVVAAAVSVASNSTLAGSKFVAAWITGSVSILSEGVHSGLDLLAALTAFFAVRRSRQHPDREHPFGHGKFESISGLVEGALIVVAVALIVWRAVARMVTGEVELTQPAIGIGVMAVSAAVNIVVSRLLFRVARQTDSMALEADAWHLRTDVWTSAGVFAGLAIITLGEHSGIRKVAHACAHLDPLIAIAVAVVILKAAWDIMRRSWDHLVDRSLPAAEVEQIETLLREHYPGLAEYHRLRTRKAGPQRHIDLHVVVPGGRSVAEAHALCDHLESDLVALLPRSEVMIHVEPEGNHE